MAMRNQSMGVRTRMVSSRFQVATPYSHDFILFAHSIEGRWRKRSGIWSFERHHYPKVAQKLNELFGTSLPFDAEKANA